MGILYAIYQSLICVVICNVIYDSEEKNRTGQRLSTCDNESAI